MTPPSISSSSSRLTGGQLTRLAIRLSDTRVTHHPRARSWICDRCQSKNYYHNSARNAATSEDHGLGKVIGTRIPIWRSFRTSSRSCQDQSQKPARSLPANDGQDMPTSERINTLVSTVRNNWNDLVGYTDIEKQREKVELQEQLIKTKRAALHEARDAYRLAVEKHATSLRDSRDLLARKDEWTEKDAIRFTTLHQAVRTNEIAEREARQAATAAELDLERETERLSVTIGKVYQAESMYNSKIIQMKTWWTWALMALNATVFLVNVYLIQVGLSPRSRRAVGLSDEAILKVRDAVLDAAKAQSVLLPSSSAPEASPITVAETQTAAAAAAVAAAEKLKTEPEPMPIAEELFASPSENTEVHTGYPGIHSYREWMYDWFSDRSVTIRQVDLTSATLEGAFAGMVVAGLITRLIRGS